MFSFLQIFAMFELIQTFNQPLVKDHTYAYLLCGCLFIGQIMETILSAMVWAIERYVMNEPIRMLICSLVSQQINNAHLALSKDSPHDRYQGCRYSANERCRP